MMLSGRRFAHRVVRSNVVNRTVVGSNNSTATISPTMLAVATTNAVDNAAFSSSWPSSIQQIRPFSSLSLLKDLRNRSGAPMMECKKALDSSDGDLDKALEWLRKHGAAKASSKLAGRDASEGLVGIVFGKNNNSDDDDQLQTSFAMVRVSSETDFAGRSQAFCDLVTHVADATLSSHVDDTTTTTTDGSNSSMAVAEDALMKLAHNGKTIKEALDDAIVAIRENLRVSEAVYGQVGDEPTAGAFCGYVHGKVDYSDTVGTSAAVVHVVPADGQTGLTNAVLKEVGKKLAMHVVAAKPLYLSPDTVPEEALEKEKDILREQVRLFVFVLAFVSYRIASYDAYIGRQFFD